MSPYTFRIIFMFSLGGVVGQLIAALLFLAFTGRVPLSAVPVALFCLVGTVVSGLLWHRTR